MHALLVTFRPEVSEPELMEKVGPRMKEIAEARGLVMKTYVAEADSAGSTSCWRRPWPPLIEVTLQPLATRTRKS